MGPLDNVTISLRVFGDNLVPQEITNKLSCTPTMEHKKGDALNSKSSNRIARTGAWHLKGDFPRQMDLEIQITSLLSKMTDNIQTWEEITSRFHVDLFCGLFLADKNGGFSLTPEVMRKLANRGIEIGFDIYGP